MSLNFQPRLTPLTERFYSSETGAPFERCLMCDASLLTNRQQYIIEQAFRRYPEYDVEEVIFEYAMCLDCYEHVIDTMFSEASKRDLDAYFESHVDLEKRAARLLAPDADDDGADDPFGMTAHPSSPTDLGPWMDDCIVHGTQKEELREYQTLIHCMGDEIVLTHLPMLIGAEAVDDLVQRLSNQTLDDLGGFRDEYMDVPPDLKRDLTGPVPV